jgi:hypothetical protein
MGAKLNFILTRLKEFEPESNDVFIAFLTEINQPKFNIYHFEVRTLLRRLESYQKKQAELNYMRSEILTYMDSMNPSDY